MVKLVEYLIFVLKNTMCFVLNIYAISLNCCSLVNTMGVRYLLHTTEMLIYYFGFLFYFKFYALNLQGKKYEMKIYFSKLYVLKVFLLLYKLKT